MAATHFGNGLVPHLLRTEAGWLHSFGSELRPARPLEAEDHVMSDQRLEQFLGCHSSVHHVIGLVGKVRQVKVTPESHPVGCQ